MLFPCFRHTPSSTPLHTRNSSCKRGPFRWPISARVHQQQSPLLAQLVVVGRRNDELRKVHKAVADGSARLSHDRRLLREGQSRGRDDEETCRKCTNESDDSGWVDCLCATLVFFTSLAAASPAQPSKCRGGSAMRSSKRL